MSQMSNVDVMYHSNLTCHHNHQWVNMQLPQDMPLLNDKDGNGRR